MSSFHIELDPIIFPRWHDQIEKWINDRGAEWWQIFDAELKKRNPSNVRGARRGRMDWVRDRFYELAYMWHDLRLTAADIERVWIAKGHLGKKPPGDRGTGPVNGMIQRLIEKGVLDSRGRQRVFIRPNRKKDANNEAISAPRRFPSPREIMEMRRQRVANSGGAFDSQSREERGLPAAGLANQQHPDHATGVTYDMVHRMEHGRTNLFSGEDRKLIGALRRLIDIQTELGRIIPDEFPLADYLSLRPRDQEMVHMAFGKLLPRLKVLTDNIERLPKPETAEAIPMLSVPEDHPKIID